MNFVFLFFIILPLILALLGLKGLLTRNQIIYSMMISVTLLVYIRYLKDVLEYLRKIQWTFSMEETPRNTLTEEEKKYLKASLYTNLDYNNYPGTSYMGYEHGWVDSAFGSASGGSNKQATIQKWSPPTYY